MPTTFSTALPAMAPTPVAASIPMAIASGHSPCWATLLAAAAESGLAAIGDPWLCLTERDSAAGSDSANSASMMTETTIDTVRSWVAAGVCSAAVSEGTARMNTARVNRMTNSSGRLPSAVCRRPVALGPSRSPSASTEQPTRDASAASATADRMKATTALAWAKCSAPGGHRREHGDREHDAVPPRQQRPRRFGGGHSGTLMLLGTMHATVLSPLVHRPILQSRTMVARW